MRMKLVSAVIHVFMVSILQPQFCTSSVGSSSSSVISSFKPNQKLAFVSKSANPLLHVVGGGDTITQEEVTETKVPISDATEIDEVSDVRLMKDIEMLSDMLAEVVKKESPHWHELYMELRKHGMERAEDPDNVEAFEKMKKLAFDLSPEDTYGVMRTFALALNLVNSAEVHHRLRVMRSNELRAAGNNHIGPLPMLDDSVRGTIETMLEDKEATKDEIFNKLINQKVEIVLTAHPTEVNRRTLLRKYRNISVFLDALDRPDIHPYEKEETLNSLRRTIAAIWGSDEIRRQKPTPQQEAFGGHAVIASVLWDAVPAYLRKLDAQCRVSLGRSLPIDVVPIKFASWIGGDRDGNPNVTPAVTKEVVAHQRLLAAKLFLGELNELYNELAISSRFSEELEVLADTIDDPHDKIEKYRRIIGHLRRRLAKTVKVCEDELQSLGKSDYIYTSTSVGDSKSMIGMEDLKPILESSELMDPLMVMYDSLLKTGFELVAEGRISDIIRRLSIFGMTLVPLDIREESTRHTLALDAITQYLGVGSYKDWDEKARLNWLQAELSSRRPLFHTEDLEKVTFDKDVRKTLDVFKMASLLGPGSLGAYVISQAQTASDVLAVMLLQKEFGMNPENGKMMRVVPLFETLNDLVNAPDVLDTLFRVPYHINAAKGKMEVMVGYSDSAKDAGRLAACWALYNSQEKMVKVGKKFNMQLNFFHGKGGTVSRGGNPALYRAILSHPPNTINGQFRVTEQGEMITQNFGSPDIAERTLDIYTAAVLREAFVEHVEPTEAWRNQMQRVSDVSCAAYRQLVREEPRFVPYFRQATPELELGILNIGSRPAKRNPKGGIESLRAIPWTFAWTQTRTHLSAWLGVGEGLTAEDENDQKELKEMYQNWPWFREVVDLIGMILSKTDFSISKNYDDILVDKEEALLSLGDEVREKLVLTRQSVVDVSGSDPGAGPHVQLLRRSSKIRHPYVDSINVVQAELLKEIRLMGDDSKLSPEMRRIKNVRKDALICSISGIAQGMKNSG